MVISVGLLFTPKLGETESILGSCGNAKPPVNSPVATTANPWEKRLWYPGTFAPLTSNWYSPIWGEWIRTPSTLLLESRPAGFGADSMSPGTLMLSAVHWFPLYIVPFGAVTTRSRSLRTDCPAGGESGGSVQTSVSLRGEAAELTFTL